MLQFTKCGGGKVKKVVLFWALILCVFSLLVGGEAFAKAEYEWSFTQPWSRPLSNKGYEFFCDKVKEYSGGRIEIKFYPDGLLGNHDESYHAVQEGSIAIGTFSPYVNLVPGGMLNWMPWTVENFDEARLAYSPAGGILFKVMEDAWEEVGFHVLFNVAQGPYGIANSKRPIRTPEDFKNLKLRVSSSLGFVKCLANMGEGTGMTLETIPWSELYNAMARKVVDGCWTMWPSLVDERHYEVAPYYTDLQFAWDAQNIVMNKKLWDSLPDDLKEAVSKAALEADEYLLQIQEAAQKDYIATLEKQEGFEIIRLTDEERQVFRDKARMSGIWEELCTPWLEKKYPGQNMTQVILDELDRIHEEVAAKKK
jgi:TRAP-type C4-dicarboxylate transport system substrate-binding protein